MRALFAPEPRADLLRALLLALGIGAVWALRDWSALTELRLSDTDDLMRLQQVRDWIGGQAFAASGQAASRCIGRGSAISVRPH